MRKISPLEIQTKEFRQHGRKQISTQDFQSLKQQNKNCAYGEEFSKMNKKGYNTENRKIRQEEKRPWSRKLSEVRGDGGNTLKKVKSIGFN